MNPLEPLDSGRIVLQGEEISSRGVDVDRIRRKIGIVFHAYNLFPHMSVLRKRSRRRNDLHGPTEPRTQQFLQRIIEAGRL